MRGPLPQDEFDWIFARVPRLTVELVIAADGRGVLLSLRDIEPCRGLWHLPGGTVRFGEPVADAVTRVGKAELDLDLRAGELLGYIEYPSHYQHGLDSPVGLAFRTQIISNSPPRPGSRWFTVLPENMHDEQQTFLTHALGALLTLRSDAGERLDDLGLGPDRRLSR